MSTTDTQNSTTLTQKEKEAIRKTATVEIREGIAEQARGALRAGQGLVQGMATFDSTETKEAREWATIASGRSWKTCESYIAIAKMHRSLPKAVAAKVESWPMESLQGLVATPDAHRKTVAQKAGTYPTVETVRSVRDTVVSSSLTDEEKEEAKAKEKAKAKRDRENAAEKTSKLADDIRKDVKRLATKADPFDSMIGAVLLVSGGRTPEQVAEAIRRIQNDVAAAQKVVAEQARKEAEAGKALAALKPEGSK